MAGPRLGEPAAVRRAVLPAAPRRAARGHRLSVAYVDASAFLKRPLAEAERFALAAAIEPYEGLTASALLRTEALRAGRRAGPRQLAEIEHDLVVVDLIPLSDTILAAAGSLSPPTLRSLDAIHVATALALGDDVGLFVAYDQRLLGAAAAHGLPTAAP